MNENWSTLDYLADEAKDWRKENDAIVDTLAELVAELPVLTLNGYNSLGAMVTGLWLGFCLGSHHKSWAKYLKSPTPPAFAEFKERF